MSEDKQKIVWNKNEQTTWECPECDRHNDICDDLTYEEIADCEYCDYVGDINGH